ncbi:hypothetical protein GIB67_002794 [Kingdonia uniflora]|uniref:Uncharacterized protein n=1 Tax=Kingdonia uniflora TaxID=39325 RepID=A0A7J7P5E8_9MAGN|nr:hypothetical protein GIB67_002794 [Kingdonia uniflora]
MPEGGESSSNHDIVELMKSCTTHDPTPILKLDPSSWATLQGRWKYAIAFKSLSPNIRELTICEGVKREWAKLVATIPPIAYERDTEIFTANFANQRDFQTVLAAPPANVFGYSILQQPYDPMLHQTELQFLRYLCWVQVSGLPCCLHDPETLVCIGNKLGEVIPNVFTYNVLIHCLRKVGSLKSALDLLRTVEFDTRMEIDSFTLNVLIKGFCRVGLLGNAELMMDQFALVGIDRDIVKVNCVKKLFGLFVLIDLMNLNRVLVDVELKTAWVEAGATLGSCGHIGGGDWGLKSRKYGLASDNVVNAILVDSNGRLLDRQMMGEDVFWAIRGGGPGSLERFTAGKLV